MFEKFLKYIAEVEDVQIIPTMTSTASADIEKKIIYIPQDLPSEFSYIIVSLLLHEGYHIKSTKDALASFHATLNK